MALIAARGIGKSFGSRSILRGLDFDIEPGVRLGVIGPNGGGKSTLLRILAGEEVADTGEVTQRRGLVVAFLPQQPEDFSGLLAELEAETMRLAATPYDSSNAYWRNVVELRLRAGDAAVAAAHAAMLHCGARGYLKSHRAQRRLREAYFVAIVTPATKQLGKMLADNAREHPGDQG